MGIVGFLKRTSRQQKKCAQEPRDRDARNSDSQREQSAEAAPILLTFIAMDCNFPDHSESLDIDFEATQEEFDRMAKAFAKDGALCADGSVPDIYDRVYAASLAEAKAVDPELAENEERSEHPDVIYYWPAEIEDAANARKTDGENGGMPRSISRIGCCVHRETPRLSGRPCVCGSRPAALPVLCFLPRPETPGADQGQGRPHRRRRQFPAAVICAEMPDGMR